MVAGVVLFHAYWNYGSIFNQLHPSWWTQVLVQCRRKRRGDWEGSDRYRHDLHAFKKLSCISLVLRVKFTTARYHWLNISSVFTFGVSSLQSAYTCIACDIASHKGSLEYVKVTSSGRVKGILIPPEEWTPSGVSNWDQVAHNTISPIKQRLIKLSESMFQHTSRSVRERKVQTFFKSGCEKKFVLCRTSCHCQNWQTC